MDDTLAYDGSNNPQKRELTARERDILCKVIREIIEPPYVHDILLPFEKEKLLVIFTVLDPRN
jgi:hypothetical protein